MKTRRLYGAMGCVLLAGLGSHCLAAPAPEPEQPKEYATLRGHQDNVVGLAFSPDGKTLISAGRSDGTIRLWDVTTAKMTATLEGHTQGADKRDRRKFVNDVSFSPDGKTVASGGDDGTARIWDVATGQNTVTLEDQTPVTKVAFSPDGKSLFATGAGMRLWDLETKQRRTILTHWDGWHPVVWFDANGRLLVAGILNSDRQSRTLAVYDVESGKSTAAFTGHTAAIQVMVFSPDGTTVASADLDYTIRLWDTATGKNTATFDNQPELSWSLAFSADGKILACSGRPSAGSAKGGGTIRLLDVRSGKVLATLRGHTDTVASMVFSPDGRLLASGSCDRTIKLWRLPAVWKADK